MQTETFPVRNRWTNAVQFKAEITCAPDASIGIKLGLAVRWGRDNNANLRYANLRDADLRGADLRYADLRGADLRGADLIVITLGRWTTYITKGQIRIGCQFHDLEKWKNFTDLEIKKMDSRALDVWKNNKDLIIGLCERFDKNG